MLGGPIIAGATLSRFFALHVFVLPATMLAFAGLHVWLVLKLGINEWPAPGRIVRHETYLKEYHALTHRDGIPFVPQAIWKDAMFAAAIILSVAFCAAVFGPFGPTGTPDPTITQTAPRPDFFFLWIYSALAYLPPSVETPLIFIAPVIGLGTLFALPFIASGEELVSPPCRRSHAAGCRCWLGDAHASRHVRPVESAYDCVDRRRNSRPHGHGNALEQQGALIFK